MSVPEVTMVTHSVWVSNKKVLSDYFDKTVGECLYKGLHYCLTYVCKFMLLR